MQWYDEVINGKTMCIISKMILIRTAVSPVWMLAIMNVFSKWENIIILRD